MKRLAASLVAAAALLGSTLAGTALGQDTNAQGVLGASQAFNAQQGWNDRSDQDRYRDEDSERARNGSNWGSDRGRFDRTILQGRWVADHRAADFRSDRGVFRGRGPMRETLLPDFIRIDQKPSMVRIADSKNRALQQIMLGGKLGSRHGGEFDSRQRGKPDYLLGRWRGSTLVVEHSMPRGAVITQTFALENRGRTLVVRTRREGFGPRTMEITSTYRRA
jgi:hypothetical protein